MIIPFCCTGKISPGADNARRNSGVENSNNDESTFLLQDQAPTPNMFHQICGQMDRSAMIENVASLFRAVGTVLFAAGVSREICESMMPMSESKIIPAVSLSTGALLVAVGTAPVVLQSRDGGITFVIKALKDFLLVAALTIAVYLGHAHNII